MVSPAPLTNPRPTKRYALAQVRHGEAALLALARYGYLTNPQLAALLYAGDPRPFARLWDVCNRQTLAPLLKEGWIERVPVQHDHPDTGHNFQDRANLLTLAGYRQLEAISKKFGLEASIRRRRGLKQRIFNSKLDHKLTIRDGAITIEAMCRRHDWRFEHWLDDADFRSAAQRRTIRMKNQPDGFCVITVGQRRCPLFLEVDRKRELTESLRSPETAWRARVENYGWYVPTAYDRDPFWRRMGLDPTAMERPIVLTMTEDDDHVDKQLAATRAAGGRGTYWYASWPAINAAADLAEAPIWRVTNSQQPRRLIDHLMGKPSKTTDESPHRAAAPH